MLRQLLLRIENVSGNAPCSAHGQSGISESKTVYFVERMLAFRPKKVSQQLVGTTIVS